MTSMHTAQPDRSMHSHPAQVQLFQVLIGYKQMLGFLSDAVKFSHPVKMAKCILLDYDFTFQLEISVKIEAAWFG
jgi:hypothetical protein